MAAAIPDDLLLLALGRSALIAGGADFTIHPDDEMLRVFRDRNGGDGQMARAMYLDSGFALWQALRRVVDWRFPAPRQVGRLLDFAGGYGRVTRFIARDLGPERVWAADVMAPAVEFQRRQLGVHGLLSSPRPEDFAPAERFDCIVVSSLFTHLPEATFRRWLRRLWELLAPGGVLAFSVHDAGVLPAERRMPDGGMLFEAASENTSLAADDYGSCWVTERFVRDAVREAAGEASALRLPRALANYQDLYVVVAEPRADFSALVVPREMQSFVEHCDLRLPDTLVIDGWVADRGFGALPVEVRARLDSPAGAVAAATRDFVPRPDVAALFPVERVEAVGWHLELRLPPPPLDLSAPLVIEGVAGAAAAEGAANRAGANVANVTNGTNGAVVTLAESSVEAAILRSTRLQLFLMGRAGERFEREQAAIHGDLERRIGERDARIAAMRASAFWRLRDRWFALKRVLRLTDER